MVSKESIDLVEETVKEAVNSVFKVAFESERNKNDHVVFLANGAFDKRVVGTLPILSPFAIDAQKDAIADHDRVEFYVNYLNSNPSIQYKNEQDEKIRQQILKATTYMEMMIYCHIWESTRQLKILKHLSNFVEGKAYNWKLEINQSKTTIENTITALEKKNLSLSSLIRQAYHDQIRNSFAHSKFSFGMGRFENDIAFWDYNTSDPKHITGLKFNEWDRRFAISVTIGHYIIEKFYSERQALGDTTFEIFIPDYKNRNRLIPAFIQYKPEFDMFNFKR